MIAIEANLENEIWPFSDFEDFFGYKIYAHLDLRNDRSKFFGRSRSREFLAKAETEAEVEAEIYTKNHLTH